MVEGDSEADSISETVPDRVPSLMRAVTSRRKHKPAARPHVVVQTSESGDSIMCAPQNLHSPRPESLHRSYRRRSQSRGKHARRERGEMAESEIETVNRDQKEKEFHQERDEEGNQVFALTFPHIVLITVL